jgi:hypothetical protein
MLPKKNYMQVTKFLHSRPEAATTMLQVIKDKDSRRNTPFTGDSLAHQMFKTRCKKKSQQRMINDKHNLLRKEAEFTEEEGAKEWCPKVRMKPMLYHRGIMLTKNLQPSTRFYLDKEEEVNEVEGLTNDSLKLRTAETCVLLTKSW